MKYHRIFLSYKQYFILCFTLLLTCLIGCRKETAYEDIATNNGYNITAEVRDNEDSLNTTQATSTADLSTEVESDISKETTKTTEVDTKETNTHTESTTEIATNNTEFVSEKSTEEKPSTAINPAIPKDNIKVGILYTTTPTEYIGYTYSHDLGIQGMQRSIGLSDEQIIRKIYVDETNATVTRDAIQECIDDGCNIIFTTSAGYSEVTAAMAKEYPSIYFANASGELSNGTNFINYSGLSYQADYLSGIAAGKKTKTNKIGFVSPMDINNSEITSGINAFAMGVHSVNPDATVYVRITTSWLAPKGEEQCAKDLSFIGCDVLAQHCYTTAPQQVADQNGFWGIGYNTDMGKETSNATLCSVTTDWSAYYTFAVENVINGIWTGENYYGGLREGIFDLTALNDNLNAQETISLIEDIKSQILSGTFHIFNGLIETNTGATVGTKGSRLDDATIASDTNWYYKNVLVLRSTGDITDGTELLASSKETSQ